MNDQTSVYSPYIFFIFPDVRRHSRTVGVMFISDVSFGVVVSLLPMSLCRSYMDQILSVIDSYIDLEDHFFI